MGACDGWPPLSSRRARHGQRRPTIAARALRATFGALIEAKRITPEDPSPKEREARLRGWLAAAGERGRCPDGAPFSLFVDPAGRFRVACPVHDPDLHGTPRGTRFLPAPTGDLEGRPELRAAAAPRRGGARGFAAIMRATEHGRRGRRGGAAGRRNPSPRRVGH
jgi:hypothetical protein